MAPELGIPYSIPYHRNDGAFPIHGSSPDFIAKFTIPSDNYLLQVTPAPNGSGPALNYEVDWGDGTVTTHTNNNVAQHTYATAGVYEVKWIEGNGNFNGVYQSSTSVRATLTEIVNWGNATWTDMYQAFYACTLLNKVAKGFPNTPNDEGVRGHRLFQGCNALTALDFDGKLRMKGDWRYAFNGLRNLESFKANGAKMFDATGSNFTDQMFYQSGIDTTSGVAYEMNDWVFDNCYFYRMLQAMIINGDTLDLSNWVFTNPLGSLNFSSLSNTKSKTTSDETITLDLSKSQGS